MGKYRRTWILLLLLSAGMLAAVGPAWADTPDLTSTGTVAKLVDDLASADAPKEVFFRLATQSKRQFEII